MPGLDCESWLLRNRIDEKWRTARTDNDWRKLIETLANGALFAHITDDAADLLFLACIVERHLESSHCARLGG